MSSAQWVGLGGLTTQSPPPQRRKHVLDEVKEEAERGGHDAGVLVAERPADDAALLQVGDGGRLQRVELLQAHDGFFADGFLLCIRCVGVVVGGGGVGERETDGEEQESSSTLRATDTRTTTQHTIDQ